MQDDGFVIPRYDNRSFAFLPRAIGPLLSDPGCLNLPALNQAGLPMRYRHVVLFLLDGFGWRFVERYASSYPFLQEVARRA